MTPDEPRPEAMMIEEYMTAAEKAAVRQRMMEEAQALEAEAVIVLEALIKSIDDGSIHKVDRSDMLGTPFHAELQRAADLWADADELRKSAPE